MSIDNKLFFNFLIRGETQQWGTVLEKVYPLTPLEKPPHFDLERMRQKVQNLPLDQRVYLHYNNLCQVDEHFILDTPLTYSLQVAAKIKSYLRNMEISTDWKFHQQDTIRT